MNSAQIAGLAKVAADACERAGMFMTPAALRHEDGPPEYIVRHAAACLRIPRRSHDEQIAAAEALRRIEALAEAMEVRL